MKSGIYILFLGFCLSFASYLQASELVEAMRNTVREWVAVEKTISLEAVRWSEKQMLLQDLLNVTEVEIGKLESSISEIESTQTATYETRRQLLGEQERLNANYKIIRAFLESIEPELETIKQQLPTPLKEKLEPLYQRLPEEPQQTTLGIAQRMQTVVSILTAIRQFDREITISDELRALDDGSQSEVRSVYIGLGIAYYYVLSGKDAGIGYPSEQGWTWKSQPSLRSEIEAVIAIAEQSTAEARFIALPVSIKN